MRPGEILPSIAKRAPAPSIRDCRAMRTTLVALVRMPAQSLAADWSIKALEWRCSQRAFTDCSMPIAVIASPLRRLVSAKFAAATLLRVASARRRREVHSEASARSTSTVPPPRDSRPRSGWSTKRMNRKIGAQGRSKNPKRPGPATKARTVATSFRLCVRVPPSDCTWLRNTASKMTGLKSESRRALTLTSMRERTTSRRPMAAKAPSVITVSAQSVASERLFRTRS